MYFFKSHKDGLSLQALMPLGGEAMPLRSLYNALTGEENPDTMRALLLIMVLSSHLWVAIWMLQPAETFTKAQPMLMEVSLIAAPSQKAATAAAPVAQPKPVEPKKTPVKKPVKKKKPLVRKQKELPKPLPMAEELLPEPAQTESSLDHLEASAAGKVSNQVAADTSPFTAANFQANYGFNPKPEYPGIATRRDWEGTTRLLVKVSAEGNCEKVTVQRSSGHDVLDEAAVEAVEKWKFIPARRGNTPVPSTVIVPINFVLD